jgi:hypothetical protein
MADRESYTVPEMLRLSEKLIRERVIPSCVTCDNFEHKMEVCKLFMERPPAIVIAGGCIYWRNDEIMF